jgi:hypothetical protein
MPKLETMFEADALDEMFVYNWDLLEFSIILPLESACCPRIEGLNWMWWGRNCYFFTPYEMMLFIW